MESMTPEASVALATFINLFSLAAAAFTAYDYAARPTSGHLTGRVPRPSDPAPKLLDLLHTSLWGLFFWGIGIAACLPLTYGDNWRVFAVCVGVVSALLNIGVSFAALFMGSRKFRTQAIKQK